MVRPPRLLYALVAVSGASALIYQVVWIRALGLHFGTTTPAIATVTASFMGGMGLGNALLGALAERSPRPLALYRRLELGIAISGLLVSLWVLQGGASIDALSRLCARAGMWSTPLRALVMAALMLLPTTLIGGTLPVLARTVVRGHEGRMLGALYACNTLGAIAGALLPDFVLVPQLGLTIAALCAAAGNALVAGLVGRVARAIPTGGTAQDMPGSAAPAAANAPIALLLTATTGFAGMGLELLWSRTLSHWAAALASSFAVLLAVYLAAIALGAAVTRAHADRAPAPLRVAGLLCALTGLAALAPVLAAPAWRSFQRELWPRPSGVLRPGLLREAGDALLHASFLELVPCLLMGAAFPYLAAAWLRGGPPAARTGLLFTVNTLASVGGALLIGFVWLPQLGELDSYCALALLLALSGALATQLADRRAHAHGAAGWACAAAVVALALALPGDQLARAHFRSGGHMLALREGATTTAAVAQRFAFGEPGYLELLTPGVSMSDTSQGARRYMGMMAHAGMLAARSPERALLICYGVGNTAHALLAHPELRRLDVVDISPEVLALAPWFARAHGGDPLRDPRAHVFVDDGRHHLIVDDSRYDVITAEPPPPNHAGVVNLYSRELYRLARSRLRPGGVITQWLPVFQLSQDETLAMIAAFVAELPHTALLYGHDKHFVLIGSDAPLALDAGEVARRAAAAGVQSDLRGSGIGDHGDVLGSVLQTDVELRRLVRGVAPLADDRPVIQYPWQALTRYPDYAAWFGANPRRADALIAPGAAPSTLAAARAAQRSLAELTPMLQQIGAPSSRGPALEAAVRRALALRPGAEGPLLLLELGSDRAALARRALDRPGARELLALSAGDAAARGLAARRDALEEAALTLARRKALLGGASD